MEVPDQEVREEQPVAIARSVPVKGSRLLVISPPCVARTGLLIRQVSAEARSGSSTMMLDFSGNEGAMLALSIQDCRTVLIDADARSAVFPLGGWNLLPDDVRETVQRMLRSWLLPDGRVGHGMDLIRAAEALASLPLSLPRTTLYSWKRFLLDKTYRRRLPAALKQQGVDPTPIMLARPGTALGATLSDRIDKILGHDDTLDRVFPYPEPALLVETSRKPELRIVRLPAPAGEGDRSKFAILGYLQVLTSLAVRPPPRSGVRECHVQRLIVVDPPQQVQEVLRLLPRVAGNQVRVSIVCTPERCSGIDHHAFFDPPTLVMNHRTPPAVISRLAFVEVDAAKKQLSRLHSGRWLYVPQQGNPVERWCGTEMTKALPRPSPLKLGNAEERGRSRFLVDRAVVVANRRRVERAAASRQRRGETAELVSRTLATDRLATAWRNVRRNAGGPGIDRVTVESFDERWQEELRALSRDVLRGRYSPQPYLRFWVKKPSGGERPLGVASIRDRVLMAAAADALSTVLEPHFSDLSYGYRPGRGAQRAVIRIATSGKLRDGWAVIADIAAFFDTVDHKLLLSMLREHVSDEAFVRLVAMWIGNTVVDDGNSHKTRLGVPQGSPISPVLSNLYLTPLDRWMERRGLTYARYADDFVIICSSETEARRVTADLEEMLSASLRLSLKPAKTLFVACHEGFDFLGFRLSSAGIAINPSRVQRAQDTMDAHLDVGRDLEIDEMISDLDAFVRGYRAYFDLGLRGPEGQLAKLEVYRRERLEVLSRARKADLAVLLARTERFTVERGGPPPGSYGNEPKPEPASPPELPEPSRIETSLGSVPRNRRAVRERQRAVEKPATVCAGGHLTVFGHGAYLGLEGDRIVIRRKTKLLFEAPLGEIRSVHTQCFGLVASTPVLEALVTKGIPVLFSTPGTTPWGLLRSPAAPGPAPVLDAQLRAYGSKTSLEVAAELVSAKLHNQDRMLRYLAKYKARRTSQVGISLREAADRIRKSAYRLPNVPDQSTDVDAGRRVIFSIEGRAGAQYWGAIKAVLGDAFPGRTGRGATDPINMALNYGYGILYSAIWAALLKAHLDPGIGLLHASPGDRGSLVFDLIEPFRVPVVDRPVFAILNRGMKILPNKDGQLRLSTRRHIAQVVSDALSRATPWSGKEMPLSDHINDHAVLLRDWLVGGTPFRALRIRW